LGSQTKRLHQYPALIPSLSSCFSKAPLAVNELWDGFLYPPIRVDVLGSAFASSLDLLLAQLPALSNFDMTDLLDDYKGLPFLASASAIVGSLEPKRPPTTSRSRLTYKWRSQYLSARSSAATAP
jgi:hypothetical protein